MTPTNLQKTIDDLGLIKGQIADLELQEKQLRDSLAELNAGAYEGLHYRVTISDSVRSQLDMTAARKQLGPKFVEEHTTKAPVRTVKCTARNGIDVLS